MKDVECPHDLAEQETTCADGICPLCLQTDLEAAHKRIAELEGHLRKANAMAEEFERKWYLQGDELEAFREVVREKVNKHFSEHRSSCSLFAEVGGSRMGPFCSCGKDAFAALLEQTK